MNKQDFQHESLDQLGKRAKVLIEKGDAASGKADEYYRSAGLHLIEAKGRCADQGIKWGEYLEQFQLTRPTAHRYMQIAGWSPIDLEAARAAEAERLREHRARPKSSVHPHTSVRTDIDEEDDDPIEVVKAARVNLRYCD